MLFRSRCKGRGPAELAYCLKQPSTADQTSLRKNTGCCRQRLGFDCRSGCKSSCRSLQQPWRNPGKRVKTAEIRTAVAGEFCCTSVENSPQNLKLSPFLCGNLCSDCDTQHCETESQVHHKRQLKAHGRCVQGVFASRTCVEPVR